jgi:hypothetical protein
MSQPYEQFVRENKIVRSFSPEVPVDELKWHQDLNDRIVTILEDGGWQFQIEDYLPNKLYVGQKLEIPKFVWHRVIKGNGNLIVEIEEL